MDFLGAQSPFPRHLTKEICSNIPDKKNFVFSPNIILGDITEIKDTDVPRELEENVIGQSLSCGGKATVNTSRNMSDNSYSKLNLNCDKNNDNDMNNNNDDDDNDIINNSIFLSVPSTVRTSSGSELLVNMLGKEFSDGEKTCPFSPAGFSSSTCLDFTSEDKKREYKFNNSDEKNDVKNVIIKYNDDFNSDAVLSVSYSPPSTLPPPPLFFSPVDVRTNMSSSYSHSTPLPHIISSSPSSPKSYSHRAFPPIHNTDKISDLIENDYEVQLDPEFKFFSSTIATVPPFFKKINDNNVNDNNENENIDNDNENENERSDPKNNDSFASLQNFYPELTSPMKEICSPAGSNSKITKEKIVQLLDKFVATDPNIGDDDEKNRNKDDMMEYEIRKLNEINESNKYNGDIYWIENSVSLDAENGAGNENEKDFLHENANGNCETSFEDEDDEELNLLWETATDDLLSETCSEVDEIYDVQDLRVIDNWDRKHYLKSVAVVQIISTLVLTFFFATLSFNSIGVLKAPVQNLQLSVIEISKESSIFVDTFASVRRAHNLTSVPASTCLSFSIVSANPLPFIAYSEVEAGVDAEVRTDVKNDHITVEIFDDSNHVDQTDESDVNQIIDNDTNKDQIDANKLEDRSGSLENEGNNDQVQESHFEEINSERNEPNNENFGLEENRNNENRMDEFGNLNIPIIASLLVAPKEEEKKEKLLLISESNDEDAKIEMKLLEQDAREEDKNILDESKEEVVVAANSIDGINDDLEGEKTSQIGEEVNSNLIEENLGMIQESVISNILDIQNDNQHEEEKKSESSISNESEQKKEEDIQSKNDEQIQDENLNKKDEDVVINVGRQVDINDVSQSDSSDYKLSSSIDSVTSEGSISHIQMESNIKEEKKAEVDEEKKEIANVEVESKEAKNVAAESNMKEEEKAEVDEEIKEIANVEMESKEEKNVAAESNMEEEEKAEVEIKEIINVEMESKEEKNVAAESNIKEEERAEVEVEIKEIANVEMESKESVPEGISGISTPYTILYGGAIFSVLSFFLILSFVLRKNSLKESMLTYRSVDDNFNKIHNDVDYNDNNNTNNDDDRNNEMHHEGNRPEYSNDMLENIPSPENVLQEEVLEFMAAISPEIMITEMENKRPSRNSRIVKKEKEDSASLIRTRRSSKNIAAEMRNVPEPTITRMSTRLRK